MSRATIIARLVEAGHEDLAERMVEATDRPELATAASTHLWDVIDRASKQVLNEAADEVKKRLPSARFGKTGHDEVTVDKVTSQGAWVKMSGTYHKWVGKKKQASPWEATAEIMWPKLFVMVKGGKARGTKAKEVPGMANGYNITDGRIASTIINMLSTGKM